jgi:LysM domain
MEAVMGALGAIEALAVGEPKAHDAPQGESGPRGRRLKVADSTVSSSRAKFAGDTIPGRQPRSSSIPVVRSEPGLTGPVLAGSIWAGPVPIGPMPIDPAPTGVSRAGQSATRMRLTRRGRLVVAALVVAGVTVAALLITMLVPGGAQATNSGQARAGFQGLHQIVVQPGQTLWSIASTAEPSADPRTVIQEIMTANALAGPTVTAGQLLWVPR